MAACESALQAEPPTEATAERYQVVVHVDAEALASSSEEGRAHLDRGMALNIETVRRLACDSAIMRMLEADSEPLDIGRRSRVTPGPMRRAVRSRDNGCCVFPGCSQRRFLATHHVVHWTAGGHTKLANLALLCRRHHRLVHEGGYGFTIDALGRRRFSRPDGTEITAITQVDRVAPLERPVLDPPPVWNGDRLDLDLTVQLLCHADELKRRRN